MLLSDIVMLGLFLLAVLITFLRSRPQRVNPAEIPKILEEADRHVREGRKWQAVELLELALKYRLNDERLAEPLND